jgi:DNA polymerase-3 subunit chi
VTQVDFYILDENAPRSRALFACRLTEKAVSLGHRVYLHAASEGAARELDELLWTFRDRSFLPHCLAGSGEDAPVHIGHSGEPAGPFHLLVNLGAEVPGFFERFERVAEVVDGDEGQKARGRERFRHYKDRGIAPETHKL